MFVHVIAISFPYMHNFPERGCTPVSCQSSNTGSGNLHILWVLNRIACVQVEENADFDTIKKRYRQLGRFIVIKFKYNIYSNQMRSADFWSICVLTN